MQLIITAIILFCAVGYASWRIYDAMRDGGDPCRGCELKEKCQKNRQNTSHCDCHCK